MKKTTTVALALLFSNILSANSLEFELNQIESEWATIYYTKDNSEQSASYPKLLTKLNNTSKQYPNSYELKIWQAIIIATNAAYESPFTALESIKKSKKILESSIAIDPDALQGAAFVTLGTLYYLTPGWPISFGNEDKAEQLLKTGLKLNPNSIDSNYFYADYLLSRDKQEEANKYFRIATNIPSRPSQQLADDSLKHEAALALFEAEKRTLNSGKNKFLSLLSSAMK